MPGSEDAFSLVSATKGWNLAGLKAALVGLAENRTLLGDLLDSHLPRVRWEPPEGTYLAWLDRRALGLGEEGATTGLAVVTTLAGPARRFLDDARVALSPGYVLGTGGAGHVRLNFATSPTVLTGAITGTGRVTRPEGARR